MTKTYKQNPVWLNLLWNSGWAGRLSTMSSSPKNLSSRKLTEAGLKTFKKGHKYNSLPLLIALPAFTFLSKCQVTSCGFTYLSRLGNITTNCLSVATLLPKQFKSNIDFLLLRLRLLFWSLYSIFRRSWPLAFKNCRWRAPSASSSSTPALWWQSY